MFKSYLNQRQVSYQNGDEVISRDVERGCPQGSCSGPLLWNLIADEALKVSWPDGCYAQAYADNIVLVISGDTKERLESTGLTLMKKWAD
ncbi:hypothetical protein JTE90_020168 [Oedothorax gibbosus]|uniref:Reverse transcriptase domain-containing protein n=1 Tax=Oedothorax gibbosus TaxID=931172 RepID=A0AAV6TWB1_9ARAC|nr:hypothetical protein JTE90_020168 [Oedothorax gibbosus]